jgi:tetratricopeptide (TPR) repeat protein
MPPISENVRLILWILTGLGSITFTTFLVFLDEENLPHLFQKHILGKRDLGRRINSKRARKPTRYWVVFVLSIIASVLGASIASTAPTLAEAKKMSGNYRIVVASFHEATGVDNKDLGRQLAEEVRLRIQHDIDKLSPDLIIAVWGPAELEGNKLERIDGNTPDERAAQAQALADQIDANMVVYGDLNSDLGRIIFRPEFLIKVENFFEAQEIIGPHEFGAQIPLKPSETGSEIQVTSQMFSRCNALTNIAIGLAHYFDQDYALAMQSFHQADVISGWADQQGKNILYLLMGNATLRTYTQLIEKKQTAPPALLDEAEKYYDQSIRLNSNYARAYIGLGSVFYNKALLPFVQSKKPSDIDGDLLNTSRADYEKAMMATDQPPLADISTKVHFGFGQVYLMQAYSKDLATLVPAITEFREVIKDYGDGTNPRLQELAAEAHARLGLALDLFGQPTQAASEYQQASKLVINDLDRQKLYQDRADALRGIIPTP